MRNYYIGVILLSAVLSAVAFFGHAREAFPLACVLAVPIYLVGNWLAKKKGLIGDKTNPHYAPTTLSKNYLLAALPIAAVLIATSF